MDLCCLNVARRSHDQWGNMAVSHYEVPEVLRLSAGCLYLWWAPLSFITIWWYDFFFRNISFNLISTVSKYFALWNYWTVLCCSQTSHGTLFFFLLLVWGHSDKSKSEENRLGLQSDPPSMIIVCGGGLLFVAYIMDRLIFIGTLIFIRLDDIYTFPPSFFFFFSAK